MIYGVLSGKIRIRIKIKNIDERYLNVHEQSLFIIKYKRMKKNESIIDRVVRAILGIIIIYYAYASLVGAWAIVGYIVGIVLLFTAVTGFCYLYKVIGINTKK